MREFSRVVFNRKTLLFFLMLVLMNIAFCIYQCKDSKEVTLTGNELSDYLKEYPEYLHEIQQNVHNMQKLSLFNKKDSFSYQNIEKTAKDYLKLEGIVLETGENRGIAIYAKYQLTDFLLLGLAVFLVFRFMEEQKKGLHLIVRSTVKGRIPLLCQRVGIICFGMLVGAVVLYASSLAVVSIIYPGADWGRSLQSVPEFMKCTSTLSIGEFLICDILLKALWGLLAAMLLFTLSLVLSPVLSMAIYLGVMLAGYIFYLVILPTSHWATLKYLNVSALLFGRDSYTKYLNLNMFKNPVSLGTAQFLTGIILLIILLAVSLIACGSNRKFALGNLGRFSERFLAWLSRHKRCTCGFVWEAKKILFKQKGIYILVLTGYLAYAASLESQYMDLRNPYEMKWYEEFGGPVSQEKVEAIEDTKISIEQKIERLRTRYEALLEEYLELEDKGSDYAQALSDRMGEIIADIGEFECQLIGLEPVYEQAVSAWEYMQKSGKQLWLLEPYTYHLLLKNDYRTYERNRLYIFIAVIAAFSGVMAYEHKSHMESMLHTLPRGRRTVLHKGIIVVALCSLLALVVHLMQFYQIGQSFEYHAMGYPVQSIECMRWFPIGISIRGYLCLLYGWRCLYTAGIGLIVMGVSRLVKDRVVCIAACTAGILVPVFLMSVL